MNRVIMELEEDGLIDKSWRMKTDRRRWNDKQEEEEEEDGFIDKSWRMETDWRRWMRNMRRKRRKGVGGEGG